MGKVEVEQIRERRTMGMSREGGSDGEGERQHDEVITVDAQGSLPQPGAQRRFFFCSLTDREPGDEKCGEEDEAFGGGDEAEGLIDQIAEVRGEVRQGHPDEEESAQGVELGLSLHATEPEN